MSQLVDHMKGCTFPHGDHCIWCALVGQQQSKHEPKLNYYYPDSGFLHSSERKNGNQRRWLQVNCDVNQPDVWANLQKLSKTYCSKYGFNMDLQLDCMNHLEVALKWLVRPHARCGLLTCMSGQSMPWELLKGLDASITLWIITDTPLPLRYCYGPQGVELREPFLALPYSCLVLHPAQPVKHPIKWQKDVHDVLIVQNGHRSVSEIIDWLNHHPFYQDVRVSSSQYLSDPTRVYFGMDIPINPLGRATPNPKTTSPQQLHSTTPTEPEPCSDRPSHA